MIKFKMENKNKVFDCRMELKRKINLIKCPKIKIMKIKLKKKNI